MGTAGGKIGFVAGVIAGLLALEPMIGLFLGSCFFEQGCEGETAGLAGVAIGSIVVAVAAGLLVRVVANRLLRARR